MDQNLPKAAFALEGENVIVALNSPDDALKFFNWLHSQYAGVVAATAEQGELVGRRGAVIQRSGVVKRHGVSEMQVGGSVAAMVIEHGDGWFIAETEREKTYRFDEATLQEVDGKRLFEFDEQ